MKVRSVDQYLRLGEAGDTAFSWRFEADARRDRLIREVFAPMPYRTGMRHRHAQAFREARPEWHFVLVASLMAHGWSRTQLAERYGGSPHTWSARIAEARRRGLLTERSTLTTYGALLEPEILERVR